MVGPPARTRKRQPGRAARRERSAKMHTCYPSDVVNYSNRVAPQVEKLSNSVQANHEPRSRDVHRSIRGDGATVSFDCLPPFRGGDHDSVSTAFRVCVSFTQHTGCVIEQCGKRSRCDVPRGSIAIVGGEPIVWLEAREPSEVVEIVASDATRRAIANECAPHATDLGNLPSETDPIVWSIAVRFRQAILGTSGTASFSRSHGP